MYTIDTQDEINRLTGIPECSVGAPNPAVVGLEHYTILAYIISSPPPVSWHGQSSTATCASSNNLEIAVISFSVCAEHRFGWFPGQETYPNHPLAKRGLEPFAAYEVIRSSWVRQLSQLESKDCGGRELALRSKRHFIFTFHDSTFECVSDEFSVKAHKGSIITALKWGVDLLNNR